MSDLIREVQEKRKRNSSGAGKKMAAALGVPWTGVIDLLLKRHGVKTVLVPSDFGAVYADRLRELKYKIVFKDPPFYNDRAFKSAKEVRHVADVMRVTERAMGRAIAILRKSKMVRGKLSYQGSILTSEWLRNHIHLDLMTGGCIADLNSIVACGEHTADPHDIGAGPLYANHPIILDLFPRSLTTGYYGDITRTVVRGKASPKLRHMYDACDEAVRLAATMYRPKQKVVDIFRAVHGVFAREGFETGVIRGKRQGFIHSVGHGLGLNIHEEPGIGGGNQVLMPGHLVTLEPGLYYRGTGGVRIEDLYWITARGAKRITKFPSVFEV